MAVLRSDRPRALVLDCDGTLVDTRHWRGRAWREVLDEHGWSLPARVVAAIDTASFASAWNLVVAVNPERAADADTVRAALRRALADAVTEDTPLHRDALELIEYAARKDLRVAVCSSSGHTYLERVAALSPTLDLVDAWVGQEDTPRQEPAPDAYVEAARRLDVAPKDCLAIEDSPTGAHAAAAAGMRVVGIDRDRSTTEPRAGAAQGWPEGVLVVDSLDRQLLRREAPERPTAPARAEPPPAVDVQRHRLRDGLQITTRALSPHDRDSYLAGVKKLSAQARHLRFGVPTLPPEQRLERLLDVDDHDHVAIVAIDEALGEGIGVARYLREPGFDHVAEVAIAVLDSHQRKGVATVLLDRLVAHAVEHDVTTFRAYVLAENDAVVHLLDRFGASTTTRDGDMLVIDVPIALADDAPTGSLLRMIVAAAASQLTFALRHPLEALGVGEDD